MNIIRTVKFNDYNRIKKLQSNNNLNISEKKIWTKDDYNKFKLFINKNQKRIISYDEALNKIKNSFINKTFNLLIKILLINLRKTIRIFKFGIK